MKVSDFSLEMGLNGVAAEDITAILDVCETRGYDLVTVDDELRKRGYDSIFTVDYDAYDDWNDDDYASIEPFPYRDSYQ